MTHRGVRDRGAAEALGLVLIAPVMIGLAVLVVALGRQVDDRARLRSAVAAAAQSAALEEHPAAAREAANRALAAVLIERDECDVPIVDYPTARRDDAGTTFGVVTVTLSCSVSNRGVEVVQDRPRDLTLSASATVDLFRARSSP